MFGKNYFGIFTLFVESLFKGNRLIERFSFLSCIFWSSILILVYSALGRSRKFRGAAGAGGILALYGVCMLQFFLPMDTGWQRTLAVPGLLNPVENFFKQEIVLPDGIKISVWNVLLFLWLFGILAQCLRLLIGHGRIIRLMRRLPVRPMEIPDGAKEILPGKTEVLLCSGITVPVSTAFFHKRILIPDQPYSEEELFHIIRHESVHLKKGDHLKVLLAELLCAVYWWNPCVYLLKKELERGLEFRCDLEAVQGMDQKKKAGYMQALLTVFQYRYRVPTGKSHSHIGIGMLGSGNGMRKELRERFYELEHRRAGKFPVRIMKTVSMAGVAFLAMMTLNSVVFLPHFQPDLADVDGDAMMIVYDADPDVLYILDCGDGIYTLCTLEDEQVITKEEAERLAESGVRFFSLDVILTDLREENYDQLIIQKDGGGSE